MLLTCLMFLRLILLENVLRVEFIDVTLTNLFVSARKECDLKITFDERFVDAEFRVQLRLHFLVHRAVAVRSRRTQEAE